MKKTGTILWKHLGELWPKLVGNLKWDVRNGGRVRFWEDFWLEDGVRLWSHSNDVLPQSYSLMTVGESRGEDGDWNWQWLGNNFPNVIVQKIRAITSEDRIIWMGSQDGKYSVADMYCS